MCLIAGLVGFLVGIGGTVLLWLLIGWVARHAGG